MLGLYIHIPFCKKKCFYCGFFSQRYDAALAERYIESVIKHSKRFAGKEIDTLYIGGGTPSVLRETQIEKLLCSLNSNFNFSSVKELTFEANPESASKEKFKILKKYGVNRISLGLQSADDTELEALGRVHDFKTFSKAFYEAREAGFDNINLDLIYGFPGQDTRSWRESLKKALDFESEHVSLYPLSIEENTPFYANSVAVDGDLQRDMYEEAAEIFNKAGLKRYEISNWSKAGRESLHNSNYWRNFQYIALGAGASGYLENKRYKNAQDIEKYIDLTDKDLNAVEEEIEINEEIFNAEGIMLGLRLLNEGAEIKYFKSFRSLETLGRFAEQGVLIRDKDRVKLSKDYVFVLNSVVSEFMV